MKARLRMTRCRAASAGIRLFPYPATSAGAARVWRRRMNKKNTSVSKRGMAPWKRWLIFCMTLLFAACGLAETQAFFTSQESVEREMTRLIEGSRQSIDIALFELRSPGLVQALKHAQSRGVALRLVLDVSHKADDLSAGDVRWLGGRRP